MTLKQMQDMVRVKSRFISHRRIYPEEIKWFLLEGMKNFCRQTECCQFTQDYTMSYSLVDEAFTREYDLPGLDAPGSTFIRPIIVWYNGSKIRQISDRWVKDLTGTSAPVLGTDLHGETTYGGHPWEGTGSDAEGAQYFYLRKHRYIGFYPTPSAEVAVRLDYVWAPDNGTMDLWELDDSAPDHVDLDQRFPAIYHDAPVQYALAQISDIVGDERRELKYKAQYMESVEEATRQYREQHRLMAAARQFNY